MDTGLHERIDGIILAGGKSRRLGIDKTMVSLGKRGLVEIALEAVGVVTDSIILVTNSPQFFEGLPVAITTDVEPGSGPLGGILSGLLLAEREHALVVACDMPFLNTGLLQYMVRQIEDNDVVMPRMGRIFEPLHAIYSRRCIEPIRRMLAARDFQIVDLRYDVRVRYIEREEIDAFDPSHLTFFNINTPDDLERAQAEYARRYGNG